MDSADPAHELEVIKAILLREGYLKRLQALAKKQVQEGGSVRPDLIDLLDLMRVATVEVVEAVVKWRRGLVSDLRGVFGGCSSCDGCSILL